MKALNKTEMEALKKYEVNMRSAYYSDYSRNMMRSDLEKIVSIYEKKIEKPYPMNYSCGACQLKLLKLIGKLYFEALEAKAEKEVKGPEPQLNINEIQEEATNKSKKK